MTITIYCFVDADFGADVQVVAVCGDCGKDLGHHISSNADWAHFDIMRPYHEQDYLQHATEQHGQREVSMRWLEKPLENADFLALLERTENSSENRQP